MQNSPNITKAINILAHAKKHPMPLKERMATAIELAALLLSEARLNQTHAEKKIQQQLADMMNDPTGKAFITNMTDQCFRSDHPKRITDQLTYLLNQYGIPRFAPYSKKMQLEAFRLLGKHFPKIFASMTKSMLRQETQTLILPGEHDKLWKHLQERRKEGVHINLNHLGEAILGETEAEHRLSTYLSDLANPNVEYISIKISTLFSQLNLLGWEDTLKVLGARLRKLYTSAKSHLYTRPNGQKVPKFVNLDMEEYRDLHLTVELFRRTLDDSEFFNYSAGIVLQSYLPDAFLMQRELTAWALHRVAHGGAPIKIRIVKGANLAMEKVEASLRGWPQAPYSSKEDTDANFKRMLAYGCRPEHAKAVHLGIASHNLFDIAYAMLLRSENNIESFTGFEMLEGMADHIRRVVQAVSGNMLLYCPAATQEEFQNAIAYLMRRLDENTAPENFLRHTFDMEPGTNEWNAQAALFSKACIASETIDYTPRRHQNRFDPPVRREYSSPFQNESDTDWSLPQNRKWGEFILHEIKNNRFHIIPLVLGDKTISSNTSLGEGKDPSAPGKIYYQYALADETHLEIALKTAVQGQREWSATPLEKRLMILDEIAYQLRCHRGELIGAMVADTGKTVYEADIEFSEAVDFVEYYRRSAEEWHSIENLQFAPKGPMLIAPPWNFPCSIPTGGIIAALAAGNSVIFKPAPEAVLVGWVLANILWKSGISKQVVQFFNCNDDPIGSKLVEDERLAAIILTGATETAKYLKKLRKGKGLIAETGGKNALIITAMADRDLAIKDLIQSAFGHAGQKCSACSLAILEAEVYDDPMFRLKLRDAAASLKVGSPWNPSSKVNPLINPPNRNLLRGLTTLETGEEWLLKPHADPQNSNLWSPGIKIGVQCNSFTHQTEMFGPVLGIMRAINLEDAITLANSTPFGLTSGIHTLDEREKKFWIENIQAGNCYINRGITGAIVQRQPFGGIKESCFGPGAKTGGPNFILQLMEIKQNHLPNENGHLNAQMCLLDQYVKSSQYSTEEIQLWEASVHSYAFFWDTYFSKSHDLSLVLGQDNFLNYTAQPLTLYIQNHDAEIDILRVIAGALTCGTLLDISVDKELKSNTINSILESKPIKQAKNIKITYETEEKLIHRIENGQISRLRLLSPMSIALQIVLANTACHAIISPVLANGRVELLHFLHEISTSCDTHRYGNLEKLE